MAISEKNMHGILSLLRSEKRFFAEEELSEFCDPTISEDENRSEIISALEDKIVRVPIFRATKSSSGNTYKKDFFNFLFINKEYYSELISDITEDHLSRARYPVTLDQLRLILKNDLATYLGLESFWIEFFDSTDLKYILDKYDDRFVITSKSQFEDSGSHIIGLKIKEQKLFKDEIFLYKLLQIFRKDENITIDKLLLKLNLLKFESGYAKPFSVETIKTVSNRLGGYLQIFGNRILVTSLSVRIHNAKNTRATVENFDSEKEIPGLILFYFTGSQFLFQEMTEYVSLRNLIYMQPTKNLRIDSSKIFVSEDSELKIILQSKIKETELANWINENLAVSFVIEDYDYLKLSFDKLMQEYSPVLNLDKNPGNLFRGIIEEKIREYESGKES